MTIMVPEDAIERIEARRVQGGHDSAGEGAVLLKVDLFEGSEDYLAFVGDLGGGLNRRKREGLLFTFEEIRNGFYPGLA